MKDYQQHAQASNSMVDDPALKDQLRRLIVEEKIDVAIETGTYHGTGSTRMLAESFQAAGRTPRNFYTCELSFSKYKKAVKNVRRFGFVKCLWGRSVRLDEALKFLENDDDLRHPEKFPDIYIDFSGNPYEAYIKECKRGFTSDRNAFWQKFNPKFYWMKLFHAQGEDLLRRLLSRHKSDRTLILLDSAGGIGLLEFQIVKEQMKDSEYWLLLDDVHHIKHYRSFKAIQSDSAFQVIASDASKGWALAKHSHL